MCAIIAFLFGAVVGFVGGFLCFRNNQAKINAGEASVTEAVEEVKETVKKVRTKK